MKMTAMDIVSKEFKKGLRGYNVDEVDEHLENVSDEYEIIYKENSALKERTEFLEEKLEHHVKIEATIQNTLVLAQNAAEQAKLSAEKESESIIRNANDSAQRVLDKANDNVIKINDEYEKIKQEFAIFRTKFRSFMNCQLEMFDGLENDYLKNYNASVDQNNKKSHSEIVAPQEYSDLTIKNIDERDFNDKDLEEIKTFFAKG
ncbi:DivIVA domain-containing protein [Clostridium sp.]|uniref:DivIVA domain-containing protein n=1 Tax=Clostridium sp. TaxID=1506 RepID=UPI003D6CA2C0